ncbi:hypothetical protein BDZ97DRAFT_1871491, partial [Flammula alnicola]
YHLLNHPIYWFEDGSLILDVEVQRFKVHHTLVSRHSRFFSGLAEKKISSGSQNGTISAETPTLDDNHLKHVVVEPKRHVRATDVEALLQALPLGKDSSFTHPQQLDYPRLHRAAGEIFEGMFPTDPGAFTHNHPLYDALLVATQFNFKAIIELGIFTPEQARKAILYSLVTSTEFDILTDSIVVTVGHRSRTAESQSAPTESPRPVSSPADSEICMALPMPLVIQPAIDDDGVYKPQQGLCGSCVLEKRDDWTEEQTTVWNLMDSWLDEVPPRLNPLDNV